MVYSNQNQYDFHFENAIFLFYLSLFVQNQKVHQVNQPEDCLIVIVELLPELIITLYALPSCSIIILYWV